MNRNDEILAIQKKTQRIKRQVQILKWLSFAMVLGIIVMTVKILLLLEDFPLPKSETAALNKADRYLFDIVLVDSPTIGSNDINDIVKPMLMVMQRRMPSTPYHVRIAIYGAGVPTYMDSGNAIAGFIPEEDFFFVDMRKVRIENKEGVPSQNWWAFLMAHEATHLWQRVRGEYMVKGSRGHAYVRDPLEREAFQEAQNVANSLGYYRFEWGFPGEPTLKTERPNLYLSIADTEFSDFKVRVSDAWTIRGTFQSLWFRFQEITNMALS